MSTIQYSAATIARCETILHNAGIATIDANVLAAVAATVKQDRAPIAPEAGFYADPSTAAGQRQTVMATIDTPVIEDTRTPMERRKDTRSDAKKRHMATRKATVGQMERVNADHASMGLREYTSLRSFRKVFPTMLDASNYYYGV